MPDMLFMEVRTNDVMSHWACTCMCRENPLDNKCRSEVCDEREALTEVDTNGQIHSQKERNIHTAHVSWQQIKRRRAVILHGVTEKKKKQNLLTPE